MADLITWYIVALKELMNVCGCIISFEETYVGFVQLSWTQEPYYDVELAKAHTNEGVHRKLTELIVC